MNDILSEEIVWDGDSLGVDLVENMQARFGFVVHPFHIRFPEVIQDRDVVAFENGDVVVQVLPFERIRNDSLVLDARQILVAERPEGPDRPFHLPGSRVGGRKRKVPRNIILQNRRNSLFERGFHARHFHQPVDIVDDAVRSCAEYCNF
jgi:hypothetical protein